MIGNHLEPFKFWCQKVLPNVYDDSLSYYEYLCKLNEYLNEVIGQINTLTDNMSDYEEDLTATWLETKEYIDNYFNNLDVQQEINNKLDAMAESGTLSTLIAPFVSQEIGGVVANQIGDTVASQIGGTVANQIDAVVAEQIAEPTATATASWLTTHVDPVGSAVIVDNSLTISGAAADAEVTGEKINNNFEALRANYINEYYSKDFVFDWKQGVWVNGEPDGRLTHITINRIFQFLENTDIIIDMPSGYSGLYNTYSDAYGNTRTAVNNITTSKLTLPSGYYSFAIYKNDSSNVEPSDAVNGIFTINYKINKDLSNAVLANVKKIITNEINGNLTSFNWVQGIILNGVADGRNTAISINNIFIVKDTTYVYVNVPSGYKVLLNTYSDENGNTRTNVSEITTPSYPLASGYYSFSISASNEGDVPLSVGVDGIISFEYKCTQKNKENISLLSLNELSDTNKLLILNYVQGVINAAQSADNRGTAIRSNIITCEDNDVLKFVFSSGYKVIFAEWDSNNTSIVYTYVNSNSTRSIASTHKFAIMIEKDPSGNISPTESDNVKIYSVKSINKNLKNLKIGILGDSITARPDAIYWKNGIEELTGASVTMYGHGGTMIQDDGSGYSFLDRYSDIASDTNIIIIEGGTNDWGNNGNLGTLNYVEGDNTLYGALMKLFRSIQNTYPNAKVYMCTPPQRDYDGEETTSGMGYNTASTPWTFAQCQQAITEMAHYWGVEIIDLFGELGWTANNVDSFTSDGLHPNQSGYKRMVSVVCSHINHAMYEF